MFKIEQDPNNPNITHWHFDKTTTWDDFHKAIDGLEKQAKEASEPFSVFIKTTGQMPRGNALSHMRRLFSVVGNHDIITKFVIINHKQNPIGQAFAEMAIKLFSGQNKVQLVKTEEEALAIV